MLLDAEVMLLALKVMLLPPKSIAFMFWGEMRGKSDGVFNILRLFAPAFGDGDT
jgi:hypothetical protein